MADDNSAPLPQQAIPPKVVPPSAARPTESLPTDGNAPTVRRQVVPAMDNSPSSAPRTVRLRPIAVPGAARPVAAPTLPAATPSNAPNAVDAAIKRMTSQIPLPAIEKSESPAPAVKKSTSRIPLPTAPIPMPTEAPKTIRIQPVSGISNPPVAAPQAAAPGSEPLPQASKSKTSRIPLEAAMGVPQATDGAPKTIKLKRPGEISAVKVAVPGAQAGSPTETDPNAITQRKTIRVKRPTLTLEANAPDQSGSLAEESAAAPLTAIPLTAEPAPHALPFILVAVVCLVIVAGLLLVFSAQLFGPNASLTQLSIWPGIDIPLPGSIPVEG